jgi:hypothetical protein
LVIKTGSQKLKLETKNWEMVSRNIKLRPRNRKLKLKYKIQKQKMRTGNWYPEHRHREPETEKQIIKTGSQKPELPVTSKLLTSN